MTKYFAEGIATISKGGFHFDCGLPSETPAIEPQCMRGRMYIHKNACVDFHAIQPSQNVGPQIDRISDGPDYHVKRTTRHYLIQLKVPVMENRSTTEQRLRDALPAVMGDITLDRQELMEG